MKLNQTLGFSFALGMLSAFGLGRLATASCPITTSQGTPSWVSDVLKSKGFQVTEADSEIPAPTRYSLEWSTIIPGRHGKAVMLARLVDSDAHRELNRFRYTTTSDFENSAYFDDPAAEKAMRPEMKKEIKACQ